MIQQWLFIRNKSLKHLTRKSIFILQTKCEMLKKTTNENKHANF